MSQVSSNEILFFFGAGSSAPFGIPTMKQFVIDFEKLLSDNPEEGELEYYKEIKESLEKKLRQPVDLEAIFTVIDGIIDYEPENLGLLSLYLTTRMRRQLGKYDSAVCFKLRRRFQVFVKEKCEIPEDSFDKIGLVYQDFFNRLLLELGGSQGRRGRFVWNPKWSIFTTNYDTCLEYYWREVARAGVDTGFIFNKVQKVDGLNSPNFLNDGLGIQLFKLHGSVSWLIEKGTNRVIEVMERGRSYVGRKYEGEMMIYPIAEKELYFDPYISMLLRLNRELERRSVWLVVGYSFNDPVVREIFLRKSVKGKRLILVHPQAKNVYHKKLMELRTEPILMEKWFGLPEDDLSGEKKKENFRKVNHQIVHKLKDDPRFKWDEIPLP